MTKLEEIKENITRLKSANKHDVTACAVLVIDDLSYIEVPDVIKIAEDIYEYAALSITYRTAPRFPFLCPWHQSPVVFDVNIRPLVPPLYLVKLKIVNVVGIDPAANEIVEVDVPVI